MEKKIKDFLKKYIVLIWIITAALALSAIVAMAAYKNRSNVSKKVIATQAETDFRFSSNYLEETVDDSDPNDLKYKNYSDMISEGEAINVDIRNYGRVNSTLLYPTDIDFTLSATLTDSSGTVITQAKASELLGSSVVTVQLGNTTIITLSASNRSVSLSQVVERSQTSVATINEYKIYFPSADSKVCVKLIAKPAASYRDLRTIGAVFTVSNKSSVQGSGWTGSFNDPVSRSPVDYDAFNYVITGYGASSSATIEWNPAVIRIDTSRFSFYTGITPLSPVDSSEHSGWKKITFSLNADAGMYAFQIFKASTFSTSINAASMHTQWETAMDGKSQGDPGWISENEYIWNELESNIIFDDGI